MSYEVLARKWRPQTFDDVVGQPHVLQPLLFQLSSGHLHSAILFTGTRGVGKTTLARLFAKSLNCETNGISDNPCNQCSACTDIMQGRYPDLIEVDAASRTRVEDTLELLENANYLPSRGRFKIYLIDEVHMLSNSSFNALLKTLEEPPEHVKFILATTDPQKLPITVLSRCLQFSLRAIPPDLISQHLAYILEQEQTTFDQTAVDRISQAARGSMRDAQTLLDQAIAFGQGAVTIETVNEMLGTLSHTLMAELFMALIQRDADQLFQHLALAESRSLNYDTILVDMLELVQATALMQFDRSPIAPVLRRLGKETVMALRTVSSEDLQIWYQIILQGRKDQLYAVTPYHGFEMTWIRLLAFKPTLIERNDGIDWEAATSSATMATTPSTNDALTTDSVADTPIESSPRAEANEARDVFTPTNQSIEESTFAANLVTSADSALNADKTELTHLESTEVERPNQSPEVSNQSVTDEGGQTTTTLMNATADEHILNQAPQVDPPAPQPLPVSPAPLLSDGAENSAMSVSDNVDSFPEPTLSSQKVAIKPIVPRSEDDGFEAPMRAFAQPDASSSPACAPPAGVDQDFSLPETPPQEHSSPCLPATTEEAAVADYSEPSAAHAPMSVASTITQPVTEMPAKASEIASEPAVLTGSSMTLNAEHWPAICKGLPVPGYAQSLASNCAFGDYDDRLKTLSLVLSDDADILLTDMAERALHKALAMLYGNDLQLQINTATAEERAKANQQTPEEQRQQSEQSSRKALFESMKTDPNIQAIESTFGLELKPNQVRASKPSDHDVS